MSEPVNLAAAAIRSADGLLITAGAGIGVDSGLPDFRGNEGFWGAYPALARARIRFESIASPAAFRADPTLAWGFYGHRLNLYRRTVPHEGFSILQRWASRMPGGAFVFTSNIDGQFQRAGFAQAHVLEVHGSIHHLQCSDPCSDVIWPAAEFEPDVDDVACRLLSPLPHCPRCGALARPNVLMFGDGEWIDTRSRDQRARLQTWIGAHERIVTIELGAGGAVPTVRRFTEHCGLPYIRVNPTEPEAPSVRGIGIRAGALAALREIDILLTDLS